MNSFKQALNLVAPACGVVAGTRIIRSGIADCIEGYVALGVGKIVLGSVVGIACSTAIATIQEEAEFENVRRNTVDALHRVRV